MHVGVEGIEWVVERDKRRKNNYLCTVCVRIDVRMV